MSEFFGELAVARTAVRFVPSGEVVRAARLHPFTVSRVFGAIVVLPDRVDVGLNAKFDTANLVTPGLARRAAAGAAGEKAGWEYSTDAALLFKEYVRQFPSVIAGLEANPTSSAYAMHELFPSNPEEGLKRCLGWLKRNKMRHYSPVPADADCLPPKLVNFVETASDAYIAATNARAEKRVGKFAPLQLLRPLESGCEESSIVPPPRRLSAGQRVVCIVGDGAIPFGSKATVVMGGESAVDVVVDVVGAEGSDLGHRCTTMRGHTVPVRSLLRIEPSPEMAAYLCEGLFELSLTWPSRAATRNSAAHVGEASHHFVTTFDCCCPAITQTGTIPNPWGRGDGRPQSAQGGRSGRGQSPSAARGAIGESPFPGSPRGRGHQPGRGGGRGQPQGRGRGGPSGTMDPSTPKPWPGN